MEREEEEEEKEEEKVEVKEKVLKIVVNGIKRKVFFLIALAKEAGVCVYLQSDWISEIHEIIIGCILSSLDAQQKCTDN